MSHQQNISLKIISIKINVKQAMLKEAIGTVK